MKPNAPETYGDDERVLVFLPQSRDAGSVSRVLEKIGVAHLICDTPEQTCLEIEKGAGAVLIEEEVLSPRTKGCLLRVLESQPSWSELPIIVLLRHGPEGRAGRDALLSPADVTLVERPVRANALVSIIRSALRSRRRQYLVRDQLRALDRSYRTLFDSIDEGFCVVEVMFEGKDKPCDYRFLETNPAFEKQTGLVNVKGKSIHEVVPNNEERWFEVYGGVALTGEPVRFQGRVEQLQRWFDVYAFRLGQSENRQVAILFSDITDRKQAEMELQKAKDELEGRVQERTEDLTRALQRLRAETEQRLHGVEELRKKDELLMQQGRMAAMGEMIGFIAHQWRQPLNTLGLMVQELSMRCRRGLADEEYLDNSTAAAMLVIKQMSQTIDDFRNFFKPDKSKIPFKVSDIVSNTMKLIQPSFRDANVTIDVSAGDDVVVEGYPNEYSQVLLNILMNARDVFLERKVAQPRIVIRIFREDGKAVTTIADNGGGVAEDAMAKIFEPYFTTKGPEKGTGIGLYLSKIIIENNMGGSLTVRNVEDGAEFRIEV